MTKFNKLNSKIIVFFISIVFLYNNVSYPFSISKDSLRVPLVQENIYSIIKIEQAIAALGNLLSFSPTLAELKAQFRNDKKPKLLIICGNDDLKTVQAAAELYKEGVVNYIFTTGGQARLTIPLIKNIVLEYGSVKISKDEEVTKENLEKVLPELQKLYDQGKLRERVTLSESELIKNVLEEKLGVFKDAIFFESRSTNTPRNFIYAKEEIARLEKEIGISLETIFYIQVPHQQLRTRFTFNNIFEEQIKTGKIKGVSYTIKYDTTTISQKELIKLLSGEVWRIVIYSAKNDLLDFDRAGNRIQPWSTIDPKYWRFINMLIQYYNDDFDMRGFLYNLAEAAGYKNKEDLMGNLDGSMPQGLNSLISWVYQTNIPVEESIKIPHSRNSI